MVVSPTPLDLVNSSFRVLLVLASELRHQGRLFLSRGDLPSRTPGGPFSFQG